MKPPPPPPRPLLTRSQLTMLLAGLGLAMGVAPGLLIDRLGLTGYFSVVVLLVVALVLMVRPTGRRR